MLLFLHPITLAPSDEGAVEHCETEGEKMTLKNVGAEDSHNIVGEGLCALPKDGRGWNPATTIYKYV